MNMIPLNAKATARWLWNLYHSVYQEDPAIIEIRKFVEFIDLANHGMTSNQIRKVGPPDNERMLEFTTAVNGALSDMVEDWQSKNPPQFWTQETIHEDQ